MNYKRLPKRTDRYRKEGNKHEDRSTAKMEVLSEDGPMESREVTRIQDAATRSWLDELNIDL